MLAIGIDIGGTKCAVSLGEVYEGHVNIIHKCAIRRTCEYSVQDMLEYILQDILTCEKELKANEKIQGIGISCGSPLNSKKGIILSPPNLPGWDNIHITECLEQRTGLKAWLCNDANACALAEWKIGAGKGCSSMVFMTFGTSLGAGIILNGRLYEGACDMAGELGHIRLSDFGPTGYGKMGSFEGFCSGGGIAQLAKTMIRQEIQMGNKPAFCKNLSYLESVTAEKVGVAAKSGDLLAKEIFKQVGIQLGKGLSILIDLLNPEKIIIGSIFVHSYNEIWPWAEQVIIKETLPISRQACKVVPSELSGSVGDVAALMVAEYNMNLEINR